MASNQTVIIIVCVCVCVIENADSVAGLKSRVKAARDKTKDLLKAVNGTMATLNAIPNGMISQIHSLGACAWERDKGRVDQYHCADRGQLLW